jgi:hypothetical protein
LGLEPACDIDLAASVVAADAWMLLTRSSSLMSPSRYGPGAVRVLAAVLARASGQPGETLLPDLGECTQDASLLEAAESHAALAEFYCPGHASEVLSLAASDLASAGPNSAFSAYGALLLHLI